MTFRFLYTTVLACVLVGTTSFAQLSYDWAVGVGGTASDIAQNIKIAPDGSVVVVGEFQGTVDLDPGPGTSSFTSAGLQDGFVAKYTATGDLLWAFSIGGINSDYMRDVDIDADGNLYVSGSFKYSVDADPGPGTHTLTSNSGFYGDIFLGKYDPNGNLIWAHSFGGSGSNEDSGDYVKINNANELILTGYFSGTSVDFDPSVSTTVSVSTNGVYDVYVAKYTLDGNFIWVKTFGSTSFDVVGGMDINSQDEIVVAGYIRGSTDMDPGPGTLTLAPTAPYNTYITVFDTDGNHQWAKMLNATSWSSPGGVAWTADGGIFSTGHYFGTLDLDPGAGTANVANSGSYDAYLSKLDSSGNYEWGYGFGTGGAELFFGADTRSDGSLVAVGVFSGTIDFDPGPGVTSLTASGTQDGIMMVYEPDGTLIEAHAIGGSGNENIRDVIVDGLDNVYLSGGYNGTMDADPGAGVASLPTYGENEIFFAKYAQPCTPDSVTQNTTICYGDSVLFAGMYYNTSGTYYTVDTAASGCDSTTTLNLEVLPMVGSTLVTSDTTVTLSPSGTATIGASYVVASIQQGCAYTLTLSDTTFTCFDLGANDVLVTVTDAFGNVTVDTAVVTIDGGGVFNSTLACGLGGYWALDSCEGTTLVNEVALGSSGTLLEGKREAGYLGQGLTFDGIDDGATFGQDSSLVVSSGASWAFWVKTTQSGRYRTVLARNPENGNFSYMLSLDNGRPTMYLGGMTHAGPYRAMSAVNDGAWHHVAVTLSGDGVLTFYRDGVVNGTITGLSGSLNANLGTAVTVGYRTDITNDYRFAGQLDELRAYATAIPASVVSELAGMTEAPTTCGTPTSALAGYWSLNNCNITTVTQTAGGSETGALVGAARYDAGYHGEGLSFDGSTAHAVLHDTAWSPGANDGFSYSLWMNANDTVAQAQTLLYKVTGAGFGPIVQLHRGMPRVFLGGLSNPGPYLAVNDTLHRNQWTHLTVSYGDGTLAVYVNGQLSRSWSGLTGTVNFGSGPHWLAMRSDYPTQYQYTGSMDEVRFFNAALNAQAAMEEYTRVSNSPVDCIPNPIAYYAMDSCSSPTLIDGTGANPGQLQGATRALGYANAGLSFNGVSDYVNLGTASTFELTNDFTIAMWVYPTAYSRYQTLMVNNKTGASFAYFAQLDNGVPTMFLGGTVSRVLRGTAPVPLNTWSHVAYTYKNGTWVVYVDGVAQNTISGITGTIPANSGSEAWLGRRADVLNNYQFAGSMDEVRVYGTTLTAEDISLLAGLAQNSTDCSGARPTLNNQVNLTDLALSVYPNPSQGTFHLSYDGNTGEETTLTVMNNLGQIVYRHQGQMPSEVAIPNAKAGLYFLSVWQGDRQYHERIVIE